MSTIRYLLSKIGNAPNPESILNQHVFPGLTDNQITRIKNQGLPFYRGKVRELVQVEDKLWVYHTDRLSAFDKFIALVPYKGVLLARLSEFWLKRANDFFPTHYLGMPHERVLLAEALEPIRAEVIVRGYLAGSMARAYQKGVRRFCGAQLDEGLSEFRALPKAIITPTTKAAAYEHDEDVSPNELIARGICTAKEWDEIQDIALNLFSWGQKIYEEHGWILVDTKYEFGRDKTGRIKIIDEIHTPDSSRLWQQSTYTERLAQHKAPIMLDKENVRRYLMDRGFSGEGAVPPIPASVLIELAQVYLGVYEGLRGNELEHFADVIPLPIKN